MTPEQLRRYFLGENAGNFSAGQTFDLRDIYYDYDKYNIRLDASNELDYLAALMNYYPSMEITLSSHTDSRGSSSYNDWLSKKRANSAMRYLLDKGIAEYRIHETRGYGEWQLVNDCSDGVECSEAEHQRNRRTEIGIVRFDETELSKGEIGK